VLTIEATVVSPAAQTNTGTISDADQVDPNPANNSASATETPQQADLSVSKTVSDATPNVGDQITFTVMLSNQGPDVATGVQVTDLLPAGVSFVSANPSQGTYDTASGVWTVGTVGPGVPQTLNITATVVSPAARTNTGTISDADQFDPTAANNSASATETPQQADLSVSKTVSDATPNVGDQITFTVTLSNQGPDAATGVQVTDLLPAGVSFVSANPSQGTYDNVSGVWTVGTVSPGGPQTLSITATVVSPVAQTNTGTISDADQFDPSTANNTASATETPQQADLRAHALSGSNLVSFDPTSPTVGTTIIITGLTLGEALVGIDFRPQNGFLYGLGVNTTTGTATLYAISARTGVATAVGAPGGIAFDVPITGSDFGFDFNPTVDRIRVTTDTGLNFRINPNNGAPVDGDAGTIGIQMDGPINGATTTVDATAYTNNQPNVTVTTLYTLAAATDQLFIQNPPNNGTQTVPINITLNGNSLDFSASNGFDIPAGVDVTTANSPASGSGLAVLTVGGITGVYSINLTTGAATRVGDLLDGTSPASGLAIQNDLGGIPAIALAADGTSLVRFNTATPGTATSVALTGVAAGEEAVGIDFRPQTGQLYAFAVDAATNTGTIYFVDPQTGAATAIGPAGQIALVDAAGNPIDLPAGGYDMDFNPTVDRIRVTTDTGLNFRINPNNGAPVDGDVGALGINPDGAINGLPIDSTGVSGVAYTNSFGQPLTGGVTTLYTLDAVSNSLFIQNPANAGTQTAQVTVKLGGSTLDFTSVRGFDIPAGVTVSTASSPATGFGFAGLTVGGVTSLYMINLISGDAINLGAIGAGIATTGLALGDSPILKGVTGQVQHDFNGDFNSDILWRHDSGQVYFWEMDGLGTKAEGSIVHDPVPNTWHIEGAGDFDGDLKSDILWRHDSGQVYAWEMNGLNIKTEGTVAHAPVPNDWHVQGVGDFNGDGNSDVLWRQDGSGQVYVWEMNGLQVQAEGAVAHAPVTTDWHIQGVGDFNGDGNSDVLWRQDGSGQVYVWEMNGQQVQAEGAVAHAPVPSDWHIFSDQNFI
jgi:uncharacterized repeat protein (TIGR01451 family)